MTITIYTAGPLFNEEQIKHCSIVEKMLEDNNIAFFSPRLKTGADGKRLADLNRAFYTATNQGKEISQELLHERDLCATRILKANEHGISDASIMIACIDDRDPGTMFEIGMASVIDMPIITYSFKNYGCNLMISQTAVSHVNVTEDDVTDLYQAICRVKEELEAIQCLERELSIKKSSMRKRLYRLNAAEVE